MRAAVVGATPPSWSVPDWYVDGSKTLPCTSDANTGTSATCGAPGVGPLVGPVGPARDVGDVCRGVGPAGRAGTVARDDRERERREGGGDDEGGPPHASTHCWVCAKNR